MLCSFVVFVFCSEMKREKDPDTQMILKTVFHKALLIDLRLKTSQCFIFFKELNNS